MTAATSCPADLDWEGRVAGFAAAGAAQAEAAALLRRAETKFLVPIASAWELLGRLADDYLVLPAGAVRVAAYESTYFDTADLALFRAAARGQRPRCKVRTRRYPDRGVAFLEVKHNQGPGRSTKARFPISPRGWPVPADLAEVLRAESGHAGLQPLLATDFRRITLVGRSGCERVTVDLGVTFRAVGRERRVDSLAVVELKQGSADRFTLARTELGRLGCRPVSASKYAFAVLSLWPEVRPGRLVASFKQFRRTESEDSRNRRTESEDSEVRRVRGG